MRCGLLLCAILFTGCATVREVQYGAVEKTIQERTGQRVEWRKQASMDSFSGKAVEPLLRQPLTVSSAVRIALVNNHGLQATLREIGISQADLVQAGLLANPELDLLPRWPTNAGGSNTEIGLMEDFLDIIIRPLRTRMAAGQLEQTQARVAHRALELVYQVQVACYTLQGRIQARDMQREALAAMDAATDLSQRQRRAGNISELTLLGQEEDFERAKLDVATMELEIQADREKLNRLLGLEGPQAATWTIAVTLPELPTKEPPLENLETSATRQRMDLATARKEAEIMNEALALVRRTGWLSVFRLGVDFERDLDGSKVVGPHLIIALPLFDRGQGRIAQARARLEQSQERLAGLETDIRSEVREARARLMTARNSALHYRDVLRPKARRRVALAQTYYGGMQLGVYDLLRIKQEQVMTEKAYFEALRDYWIARALLARAVGGGILTEAEETVSTQASPPVPASPPAMQPMEGMGAMDKMDMGKMRD